VSEPLGSLTLDVCVDWCCADHLSDLLVADHVPPRFACHSSEAPHFTCWYLSLLRLCESPCLALVSECWQEKSASTCWTLEKHLSLLPVKTVDASSAVVRTTVTAKCSDWNEASDKQVDRGFLRILASFPPSNGNGTVH
jgi:hypothetical protein